MTVVNPQSIPSIVPYLSKQLQYTAHDVKWIPGTAQFVVVGQHPRGTGAFQVMTIQDRELKVQFEAEPNEPIKCLTFKATGLSTKRECITGGFNGGLSQWDVERPKIPTWQVAKAHEGIINSIDGIGGVGVSSGPPEIATGGKDGFVKVWDTRQHNEPVVTISAPKSTTLTNNNQQRDCWAVAFGNSFNDDERCLVAGYDNGDLKMLDKFVTIATLTV